MATSQKAPDDGPTGRRIPLIAVGAGLALVAGVVIGWMFVSGGRPTTAPPPASQGGLVIDASGEDAGKIDPAKPLRCFVQGKFVGEFSLTECARRNGVATDALDVGLDETGALAAAEQAGQVLTPLPPPQAVTRAPEALNPAPGVTVSSGPAGVAPAACWRHGDGRWRRLPGDMGLDACVQTLFAGRCEKPGGASYGRWGQQTLRLVPGRVEVSDDNRSFRTLVNQAADCSLPPAT
jgi:hypothetical protein